MYVQVLNESQDTSKERLNSHHDKAEMLTTSESAILCKTHFLFSLPT